MEISRRVTVTCHGFPGISSLHPSDLVTSCSSPLGDDCQTQTCLCEGYLKTTFSTALFCSPYDLCRLSGLNPHRSEPSVLPIAAPNNAATAPCGNSCGVGTPTGVAKCAEGTTSSSCSGCALKPLGTALMQKSSWAGATLHGPR